MKTILIILGLAASAHAAPRWPIRDGEVLERLVSSGESKDALAAVRRERKELDRRPGNLELALDLARRYAALGRAEADPRYYGYAQSALARWWDETRPPVEVLILRAQIRQAGHDFVPALADLDAAVRRRPQAAQAWLIRAMVQQARGDYARAESSCRSAGALGGALDAAFVCRWSVRGFHGHAAAALAALRPLLGPRSRAGSAERLWALSVEADLARRLGRLQEADRLYAEALAYQPSDPFLLGAYADLLLDMGREPQIVSLLKPYRRNGNLLLRLAVAESRLRAPEFPRDAHALASLFEASRLRGDMRHLREEARGALALDKDSQRALELAKQDWDVQREPEDVRILFEAALAANDSAEIDKAVKWMTQTRLEDVALAELSETARRRHAIPLN